jgi:hypothetical protein
MTVSPGTSTITVSTTVTVSPPPVGAGAGAAPPQAASTRLAIISIPIIANSLRIFSSLERLGEIFYFLFDTLTLIDYRIHLLPIHIL